MQIPAETAGVLTAIIELIGRIRLADPEAGAILSGAHLRVSFDSRETQLLISLVDDHGRGHAAMAIHADPADVATFGRVGVPEPVFGLGDRPGGFAS